MKIYILPACVRVFTILFFALAFAGSEAGAKDVPVETKVLLGRWILLDVKTQDRGARAAILESRIDMTFQSDRSVTIESRNPESLSGVDTRRGKFRVDGGRITITMEGESSDEPARAVIRDGKHLVFLPSEKFPGEMIFARVKM